jgi:hypothetical protein
MDHLIGIPSSAEDRFEKEFHSRIGDQVGERNSSSCNPKLILSLSLRRRASQFQEDTFVFGNIATTTVRYQTMIAIDILCFSDISSWVIVVQT